MKERKLGEDLGMDPAGDNNDNVEFIDMGSVCYIYRRGFRILRIWRLMGRNLVSDANIWAFPIISTVLPGGTTLLGS